MAPQGLVTIVRRFSFTSMARYKLLFPGQGSQYVGMTSHLPTPLPSTVEEVFDAANKVLGYNIRELCICGPPKSLDATIHCQPAVVVSSLAAYEYAKLTNPEIALNCVAMAGFSVGELTALIASNSISLEQGLQLVKLRAHAMQDACLKVPSAMMTIIGLDKDSLQQCCCDVSTDVDIVSIANHLFPTAFAVSGTYKALDLLKTKVIERGAMSIKDIPVSGGFHSSLMESAVPKLKKAVETVDIEIPAIPVYSNVTGKEYTSVSDIKKLVVQQLTSPVLWEEIIRDMIEKHGDDNIAEIGPGKQLKLTLRKISKTAFKNCKSL